MFWIILCTISTIAIDAVYGHGMMMEPASRSSLWRKDNRSPINYDDNALFCGGIWKQYEVNGGRCGVCGDDYNATHPQENENTGKYGNGIIAATYLAGSVVDVYIRLTANHLGSFNYSLCVLENPEKPESEECFIPLRLADGETKTTVKRGVNEYLEKVQLPHGVTCERCVFRWTYKGGNNWDFCEDGIGRLGCGKQEHFRNCADISIID